MAYYNNYNRGGDYSGGYQGGSRNDGRGGYNNRGPRPNQNIVHRFNVGDLVMHLTFGTRMVVIRTGNEQVECRMPDPPHQTTWFYEDELDFADKYPEATAAPAPVNAAGNGGGDGNMGTNNPFRR